MYEKFGMNISRRDQKMIRDLCGRKPERLLSLIEDEKEEELGRQKVPLIEDDMGFL